MNMDTCSNILKSCIVITHHTPALSKYKTGMSLFMKVSYFSNTPIHRDNDSHETIFSGDYVIIKIPGFFYPWIKFDILKVPIIFSLFHPIEEALGMRLYYADTSGEFYLTVPKSTSFPGLQQGR